YAGYGETEILHGVSMRLESDEFITIIGPNGAGKSTLIKAIIGLIKPDRGSVMYRDKVITGSDPENLVSAGLAYIPQTSNTFPSLTVRENLEMGAISRRLSFTSELRPDRVWQRMHHLVIRARGREEAVESSSEIGSTRVRPY